MKLIGLSAITCFASIEAQKIVFANPVVDSIYQTHRNVRAPSYPNFNSVARFPQYKSSRFSSESINSNSFQAFPPSRESKTNNTVKKRVRVVLDHPNCKSLPNIADVQRRVESDPVIQRKLGVQVAGVLVNKFACTDSKDKLSVDFDFYVYDDVKASDFDILFNQNNYDDQTDNVQGFEDQIKDGSLDPTLLKAIGMYHRISSYTTEKPVISLVSLDNDSDKDEILQEATEQISQSIESATTQVTTLASKEFASKNRDEIIDEIVNLTLNDRILLDHIESLAKFINENDQKNLTENLAESISDALRKETLSLDNISQLQKVAAKAIIDYMANVSVSDEDKEFDLDDSEDSIDKSSQSEESDPAIEESGQEGVFENEVVESILDSDYSSQLDKLTREVEKSIVDREIQLEFLEDQKEFVKDLFGEQANEATKADYDLLDEDSDSTNDIEDIIEQKINDDRNEVKSSNLEGDVVELLNSLSKNKNDAQDKAFKVIMQEITENDVPKVQVTDKIVAENENDLKDLLLEYRDEPEIEISATEILSEIMPDFFDDSDKDSDELENSSIPSDLIKQERQEALLREIQASEEAKNEFRDTINEAVQNNQIDEEVNEPVEIEQLPVEEEQIQSSFEIIESMSEEQAETDEQIQLQQIEEEDLDADLDTLLKNNTTDLNVEEPTSQETVSLSNNIRQNSQNSTWSEIPELTLLTDTKIIKNADNSTVLYSNPDAVVPPAEDSLAPQSFSENVLETVMTLLSR